MSDKAIGIMNDAYFVGRKELLNWLNNFFQLNYTKIEEVCSGALFCQMMHALYPSYVPLSKVNFGAKYDYEYIKNYKILQEVFTKVGIAKVIEVNKLIKGKYQDNLEFLQWMRAYFDEHWHGGEYDPAAERKRTGQAGAAGRQAGAGGTAPSRNTTATPAQQLNSSVPPSNHRGMAPTAVAGSSVARRNNANVPQQQQQHQSLQPQQQPHHTAAHDQQSRVEIAKLKKHNAQLAITVDNLEKERDFYFCKLRDIEILCQNNPSVAILREVERILYATDSVVMDDAAAASRQAAAAAANSSGGNMVTDTTD